MNWFGYKNISKIIMTTSILLILSNTLLISLFYYINQMNEYENALEELKIENINKQKNSLIVDIEKLIAMIEYKYTLEDLNKSHIKYDIKRWLSSLSFDKEKSNYIFVYELVDKKGGDNFARMIINPNRPDIIGKYISTNYKDLNGFEFRKKFLSDINKDGDSIVRYSYKKTDDTIDKKISYFKYYKPLNWIIAKGVYDADIESELSIKKRVLKKNITKQIKHNIILFILLSILAVIITYFIGKSIRNIINEKERSVKKTTKTLAIFNRDLDAKIKLEVEKNKEQEQLLIQKSKFIAIGEMISLIAHQWRQPISELNAIVLNIKLHHKLNKLDDKMIDKKSQEIETLLEYMSNTIDDFRTFFKPNKKKQKFFISDSIQRVLDITSPMLKEFNIKIILHIDDKVSITNYQNELEQVILNLITNAKDALTHDKIKEPTITLNLYKDSKVFLEVKDNANGITADIIDKIFDPYFTTKDEVNGTGIGLYMSKIIIDKNMNGKLDVKSDKKGSCFTIIFI
ncbi:MAG: cache domain-containing protein [Campylobacterota bacterium]|nr:cache domain-containing protein [Campylobacterota bacterium]